MFHRFLVFSGFAALVNFLVGNLLYGVMGLSGTPEYQFAVATAFVAGMGVSFVLNRRFTYPASGRPAQSELRDFFIVSVGGLALTTLLSSLFLGPLRAAGVGALLPPESAAHLCAIGLGAFYSFFAHKTVSFRRARVLTFAPGD